VRFRFAVLIATLGTVAVAACGSSGAYSGPSSTTPTTHVNAAPGAAATTVTTGNTALGKVLVDSKGMTLYGLTTDSKGTSTCADACASVWPPLTIEGTSLPAGLDAKLFSIVSRRDGTQQLEAGKWPLYRFAGDSAPGDTNGQGSEIFFVVTPNGTLHKT
jgi:predicted lipoprotein with Yx(FWY)xxD motif